MKTRKPYRVHYIRRMLRKFPKMRKEELPAIISGPGIDAICGAPWELRALMWTQRRHVMKEMLKLGSDGHYILGGKSGHEVMTCRNFHKWADWFEKADRGVALTRVGPVFVSTTFLGLDTMSFRRSADYQPRVFETMCWLEMEHEVPMFDDRPPLKFDRTFLDRQHRCCTWDDAVKMHRMVVDELRAAEPGDEVEELALKGKSR